MVADSYLTTFIPHGSWMVADKLLTIFTPSDYLHTIRNTDASIPDYRLIEKTRTAADRSLTIGTADSSHQAHGWLLIGS